MAINEVNNAPLRHISRFVSSGVFTVPEGVNRVHAAAAGGGGGHARNNSQAHGGAGAMGSGWVAVVPGGTAVVIVGAAGTNSGHQSSAPSGGSSSFDGAIVAGGGGGGHSGLNDHGAGGQGTVSYIATSLPSVAPAGAAVRVSGSTSTTGGGAANQTAGFVDIFA